MPALLVRINVDDKGNIAIEKLGETAKRTKSSVGSLGNTLRNAFAVIGIYKGLNYLIASLNNATNESLKYEKAMKKVQAIGNESNATMLKMGDSIENIALNTEHLYSEIAEAQKAITKAGIRGEEGLSVLKHALDLVTVSEEESKAATEGLINILNAFNMGTEKAGYAANVMSRALNETILNLEEYLDAMKYSAPVAAQLGVSYEKLSAIIGILAQTGQRGSLAGTGMRNVLLNLLKVTPEVAASLKRLKIEEMGVVDLLKTFHEHGISVADLLTQFNKRGILAAIALGKNAEAVEDLHNRLTDFSRPLSQVADEMRQNLLDQLKMVNNHFIMIFNTINKYFGTGGKTVLDNFMVKLVDFNDMLKENPEILRDWTNTLVILGKTLAELVPILGFLIKHSKELITIWATATIIGKLNGIIFAFKGIKFAAIKAGLAGRSALLSMLNPIALVTTGLAGFAIALNKSYKAWKDWGDSIGEDIAAKQVNTQLENLETLITLYEQTGVQGSYNKKLISEIETNLADLGIEVDFSASRQTKLNQAYEAYNKLLGESSVKIGKLDEKTKTYGANLDLPKDKPFDFDFDLGKWAIDTEDVFGRIFDLQAKLLKTRPSDLMLSLQGNLVDKIFPPDLDFYEEFKDRYQQDFKRLFDEGAEIIAPEGGVNLITAITDTFNDFYSVFGTVHDSIMDMVASRRDFEHQRQMQIYKSEMDMLTKRYNLEVKAAGDSALQRSIVENAYQKEKSKLEAKANAEKRKYAQKQWRADMLQIALNSPVMASNFITSFSKYMGYAAIPAGLALAAGITTAQLAVAAANNPAQAFYTNSRRVEGEGNSTSDSIRALLSKGEWVLSRDDVERLGGDSAISRMITMGDNINNSNANIYIDTIIGEENYVRRNVLPIIREEFKR